MNFNTNNKKPRPVALLAAASLGISVLATGCAKNHEVYYEGFLKVDKQFPESQTPTATLGFKGGKWVGIEVNRTEWNGTINVFDTRIINDNTGKPNLIMGPITLTSVPGSFTKIEVDMPSLKAHFKLKLNHNDHCFNGNSIDGSYALKACLKGKEEVTIDVTETVGKTTQSVYSLTANPFSKPVLPNQIAGKPLTLKQAIDIALATNPASAQELLYKLSALHMYHSAVAGLFPLANLGTAVTLWSSGPTNPFSYIASFQALAPFLSPDNWVNMKMARGASKVADLAYRIVQANLATLVEGLVYNYRRDVTLLHEYDETQNRLTKLMENVKKMKEDGEAAGKEYVAVGTDRTIQTLIDETNDLALQAPLGVDISALLKALGIHNPELIKNIQIEHEEYPIESAFNAQGDPIYKNKNVIYDQADTQSRNHMELAQQDFAIGGAELAQRGRFWNLLDLASSPAEGLGAKLYGEAQSDADLTRGQRFSRIAMIDQVKQGAYDAVDAYNSALDGYKEAKDDYENQLILVKQFLSPIENYPEIDPVTGQVKPFTAITALGGQLNGLSAAFTRMKAYHAGFRMARATIDRMLLVGYYSEVATNLGDNPVPPVVPTPPSDCPDDQIIDDNVIDGEADIYNSYYIVDGTETKAPEDAYLF